MLTGQRDYRVATVRLPSMPGCALNCKIVGFCRTGRENDVPWLCPDQGCHLPARRLHGGLRLPTMSMICRMRIPKNIAEIGHHTIHDTGITRRCRLIIQIDRAIWSISSHYKILSRHLACMGGVLRQQPFRHRKISVHKSVYIISRGAPSQTDPDR